MRSVRPARVPPVAPPMAARKQRPAALLALGRREFPPVVEIEGVPCRLVRVFKHDFWAGTALYEGACGRHVLKIHRQARLLGVPLRWVGRFTSGHERRMLERLADVRGIPRLTGRFEDTGLMHEFVEGRPHRRGGHLTAEYVERLRALLDELHRRDIAYADLEKPENVLVGDDDHPYLVDFQIAWHWPPGLGGRTWPARRLLRLLQDADRYHLLKHVRRCREDLLSPEELARARRRPLPVRIHNFVVRPFTRVRRRILDRLDPHRRRERQ